MKYFLLSVTAFLLLKGNAAKAQTAGTLDSVVIRENRLPATAASQNRDLQVLTRAQIEKLPVKSTDELLSYLAGVDLRQRGPWGGQADISMDGGTGDEVLVLVNGVKMSDPQTGHHIMNLPIPITSIDHIEVLHGSAARVYGVNALAGAINIVTRLPKDNEISGQIYAGSSFDRDTNTHNRYYGWGEQVAGGIVGKNQQHLISVSHDESNGYRYNTGLNATRAFYQNSIKLSDKVGIETMGGYVYDHFGASQFYAAPYDNEAVETVQTAIGSVAVPMQLTPKFKLTPRVSYRYNKDDYIFIRDNPSYYHNIHEDGVATGELQSSLQLGKGILGMGVELRSEHINSNNLGKHNRTNSGVYAEYRYNVTERFNVSAGLYLNNNSDWGTQLFPSADASYKLTRNLKLFANASTGSRLPTYTDLYYIGPSNIGNPDLKPEKATYAAGGLAWQSKTLTAQATGFYRHTTGFIDFVKVDDTSVHYYQPQNFQSLNAVGVSARFDYSIARAAHWRKRYDLGVNVSYTYLHIAIDIPAEENLLTKYTTEALRHQLIGMVNARAGRLSASVAMRFLQRISYNDYTVLDAHVAYSLNHFQLYADGNNLLNRQYKEVGSVPMPGRWITLGMRFNLQGFKW